MTLVELGIATFAPRLVDDYPSPLTTVTPPNSGHDSAA